MLFPWNVPLINDSQVLVKMRDEGDPKCGLRAMVAVLGIFHNVESAGYTYFRKTLLLVLISFFSIILLLVLKNLQKSSGFEFLLAFRF